MDRGRRAFPNREDGDDQDGRRSAPRSKADRRPDQDRKQHVGLSKRGWIQRWAEQEQEAAQPHRGHGQRQRLEEPSRRPGHPAERAPGQKDRRHDQIPESVSHPPRAPGVATWRGLDDAPRPEREHSEGRADDGAQAGGEGDQRDDVAEAVQAGTEAGEAPEQGHREDRLQRVPDPDPQRHPERGSGQHVGHDGSQHHRGPDPTPRRSKAARAIPVGGQTSAANPLTGPSDKPQPRRPHVEQEEDDQLGGAGAHAEARLPAPGPGSAVSSCDLTPRPPDPKATERTSQLRPGWRAGPVQ